MKKTQITDIRRNIHSQVVSYISIIVIAMLAVATFLGINFAADALRINASEYWRKLNFRDMDIISTMYLTKDDIAEIGKTEGVADVEGVCRTTAQIFGENENITVDVLSMTERVSLPEMIAGRLPENFYECAAEQEIMESMGLEIGDTIKLGSGNGECAQYLRHKAFRITGTFLHADHYATQTFSGGNRYILVTDNSFDTAALDGCYMKAVVKLDVPADMSLIGKDYDRLSDEATDSLEKLAQTRTPVRDAQIQEKYQKIIDKSEKKLNDTKKELDDGRKELDDNSKKIADDEKQLEDSKKQLDAARKKLAAAKKELDAAKAKLDANKPKLDSKKAELDTAAAQLTDGWNQIEYAKTNARNNLMYSVNSSSIPQELKDRFHWASTEAANVNNPSQNASVFRITTDHSENIHDLANRNYSGIQSMVHGIVAGTEYENTPYETALFQGAVASISNQNFGDTAAKTDTWNEAHDEYIAGRNEYLAAKKKYDDGVASYKAGLADYQSKYGKYERGLYKYRKGLEELEDAKAQLAEGEERYAEGFAEYEAGLEELQQSKDTVAGLHPCRWVVLNDSCNPSYVHVDNSASNLSKLSMTFSMLFVLLGILIIYSTIARIVGEQKTQIGTVKALGFFNSEAAIKYLFFGISATLLGTVLGALVSYFVIQKLALFAHLSFYVTDNIPSILNIRFTAIAVVLGVVISSLAVWFACSELVKRPAVELMKDDMPVTAVKSRSGSKKPKTRVSSLYSRLILRNIRTDARRVAVTIISVAGCCTLLVIGFTVKDGIVNAINTEYDDILKCDHIITYDPDASETVEQDIKGILDENGSEYTRLHYLNYNLRTGKTLTDGSLVCGDKEDILKTFSMTRPRTGQPVVPGDHGVCIMRRTSVYYGLDVGDTITLYDSAMEPHEVTIEGVFENYTAMYFMMTREAYKEVFGEEPYDNAYFTMKLSDPEEVTKKLLGKQGVLGVENMEVTRKQAIEAAQALTLVTIALIICAGIMAYFIILNLASMYINKKKRELTIMRINGYTTRQTISYVAREAIVTTLLGIIAGIAVGSLFAYIILRFVEHPNAGFMLTLDYHAWWISACITVLYSVVIYVIALRKVKHLKLTDIN